LDREGTWKSMSHLKTQWETNARAYADLIADRGTPFHRQILIPCLDRLLGEVAGLRILDAGCGEGYLSRRYARRGAQVVGVDISESLVEICRERAAEEGLTIEYHVEDICSLKGLSDEEFDIVLCNLVLLNVPCLDDALTGFRRALKTDGVLVFSIVHPAFNFYGPGQWELGDRDPVTKRRHGVHFTMDNYFEERSFKRVWRTRSGEAFPAAITFYHRTISTYVRAVVSAGLQIEALEEPLPETDDPFFERERRIPMFMVFKARRVGQ